MDLPKILMKLHEELANLNVTILTLEQMEATTTRRRGRPPKWLIEAKRSSGSKPLRRSRGARKAAGG
jgi:hypothetical protein